MTASAILQSHAYADVCTNSPLRRDIQAGTSQSLHAPSLKRLAMLALGQPSGRALPFVLTCGHV